MFTLRCLTKKFNKQTLSEVKPAPPSETVDHTLPSTTITTTTTSATTFSHTTATPLLQAPNLVADTHHPSKHLLLPDHTTPTTTNTDDSSFSSSSTFIDNPISTVNNPSGTFTHTDSNSITDDSNITHDSPSLGSSNMLQLSPAMPFSSAGFSRASSDQSVSSSESEDEEEDELRIKAHAHPPRNKTQSTQVKKIKRISSAEKRKYSQFKCSTGSSSPSSSDDEIKEAFDVRSHHQHNNHHHHSHHSPPSPASHTWAWNHSSLTTATNFIPSEQPISGWNIEVGRPLKVVPVGRHKHKFFAQMSNNSSERPCLDFKKMQHSKRLVMVHRPMVIRNNSRVHSIQQQRPAPPSLQVSLDISQHSFQPVLTQT